MEHRQCVAVHKFLSTPSARRATHISCGNGRVFQISIHALREEGDLEIRQIVSSTFDISIHALREEGDTRTDNTFGKVA